MESGTIDLVRRGQWTPDPTTVRAATPHEVIRARQLMSMEIPERTIYRRCLDGGPWRRLLPGIILLNNGQPIERQLIAAALLYGGRGSIVTGLRACRWHGLRRGPLPVATPSIYSCQRDGSCVLPSTSQSNGRPAYPSQ